MRNLLRTLHQALGPESGLVLVGGAVRDLLLDRPSPDWDLATALLPDEVTARARAAGLRVIPTGLQHGTVTVMVGARGFEITT
ncbi:MAG: CCA tRNA nucleotidyltransferase, partial [Holophaga sp.]|nr:CCA tRNA nucleotidyltransferase [Holophaga sp.]